MIFCLDKRQSLRPKLILLLVICVIIFGLLSSTVMQNKFKKRSFELYKKNYQKVQENVFKDQKSDQRRKRTLRNGTERKLLSENLKDLRQNVTDNYNNDGSLTTELGEIFISVKTSLKFHNTRVAVILKTWWTKARNQIYFFTDADDAFLSSKTPRGHVINTHCRSSHDRRDLSCKMGAEYDAFMESNQQWWCHFDDDNYVNVENLVELLNEYDSSLPVYLGKPSLGHSFRVTYEGKERNFWFGTGGAGICLSRAAAQNIVPWARHGKFAETADSVKLPDDVTMGFVVGGLAKIELVHCKRFHSHLEQLSSINYRDLSKQVSLSYNDGSGNGDLNKISIDKRKIKFSELEDPTRFLTLHCLIYPYTAWCK